MTGLVRGFVLATGCQQQQHKSAISPLYFRDEPLETCSREQTTPASGTVMQDVRACNMASLAWLWQPEEVYGLR
jgi:hypothetical protein